MRLHIAATTAAALLLAPAAFAQNTPSYDEATGAEQNTTQNKTQMQQSRIERSLSGAGFTDIEMIPTSILVRARNPDGKTVMMIVDPTSMTAAIIDNHQKTTPDEDTTNGRAAPK